MLTGGLQTTSCEYNVLCVFLLARENLKTNKYDIKRSCRYLMKKSTDWINLDQSKVFYNMMNQLI